MKGLFLLAAICIVAATYSNNANGCEYHNSQSFRGFSFQQMNMHASQPSFERKKMQLEVQQQVSAIAGEKSTININYYLPRNEQSATLRFKTSKGIEVEPESELVTLNGKRGMYGLIFVAKASGEHQIEIQAEAFNNGTPYSYLKSIQVIVQ